MTLAVAARSNRSSGLCVLPARMLWLVEYPAREIVAAERVVLDHLYSRDGQGALYNDVAGTSRVCGGTRAHGWSV